MGYYSDVALTLRKEDALELIKQAKESNAVRPFMCIAHVVDQDEYVTFYWEWVKWYDDYEEIQFITAFYRNLAEYSFKRIGEDTSDIEEEWDGDDDNICRQRLQRQEYEPPAVQGNDAGRGERRYQQDNSL